MKVIILYGPPATGKLTIAKELSKKNGFKVFDNHYASDFLNSIVLDKSPAFASKVFKEFWGLYRRIRFDVLRTACKLKDVKGLILTEAYTGKKRMIANMIKIAEENKCKVYMVKLKCDVNELEKRVYSESRKPYKKVKNKKALQGWFDKMGKKADSVYPYKKTLVLDNTKQSVNQSVKKILEFVK
jgi:shikimate kinase